MSEEIVGFTTAMRDAYTVIMKSFENVLTNTKYVSFVVINSFWFFKFKIVVCYPKENNLNDNVELKCPQSDCNYNDGLGIDFYKFFTYFFIAATILMIVAYFFLYILVERRLIKCYKSL